MKSMLFGDCDGVHILYRSDIRVVILYRDFETGLLFVEEKFL